MVSRIHSQWQNQIQLLLVVSYLFFLPFSCIVYLYRKVKKRNAKTRLLIIYCEGWRIENSFGSQEPCNNHFPGDCFRAGKRGEAHSKSSPGSSSEPTQTFFVSEIVKCYKYLQPGQWEKFSQRLITERLDTFCSTELIQNLSMWATAAQLLAPFTPYLLTSPL